MSESESRGRASGGAAVQPSKKRARTISNLTEKQIQHKREVDRKAQRAFRQRTKDCLANLEEQHARLQETSRETEARLRREMQELHEENQRLLQRLESILDVASGATNRSSVEAAAPDGDGAERRMSTSEAPASSRSCHSSQHGEVNAENSMYTETPNVPPWSAQEARSPSWRNVVLGPSTEAVGMSDPEAIHLSAPVPPETVDPLTRAPALFPGAFIQADRTATPHDLHESYPEPFYPGFEDETSPSHGSNQPQSSGHLEALGTALSGGQTVSTEQGPAAITPCSTSTHDSGFYGRSRSACDVLPLHVLPTCPLDEILLAFLNSRREMLSNGIALEVVIGLGKPTVKALVDPELCDSVDGISHIVSEILSTFPHVDLVEKLAFFYIMHRTMRVGIGRMTKTLKKG